MRPLPLIEEIFTPPAACDLFRAFENEPSSFFLDSGMDSQRLGRYSFLGASPFLIVKSRGNNITISGHAHEPSFQGNPFDVLETLLERYRLESSPCGLPFIGGAVGYMSYDLGRHLERLPSNAVDDLQLPELCMGFYDAAIVCDHLEGRAFIVSTGLPETGEGREKKAKGRLAELGDRVAKASAGNTPMSPPDEGGNRSSELRSNFTHAEYLGAVEAAREHIRAGDIFQVNISQRFETEMSLPPYELYRRLRDLNPAPFACYLNFDDVTVVGTSPERFLQLRGDRVETRPIKGTRPRGRDAASDQLQAQALTDSTKDRAEHVMIVDLERNDLGRVCRYGTVQVSELMCLEKYATVFHLTSTVEGRLRSGKNAVDLLRAAFPGGSITGAPKVRAMEIIDELEPTRRSIYTGSIGYISFDGSLDLNIVIRTILIKEGRAYFQVGGAVVYDSVPEAEYAETLDKARALVQALTLAPQPAREGYDSSH